MAEIRLGFVGPIVWLLCVWVSAGLIRAIIFMSGGLKTPTPAIIFGPVCPESPGPRPGSVSRHFDSPRAKNQTCGPENQPVLGFFVSGHARPKIFWLCFAPFLTREDLPGPTK